jgi:hypothetical protein
MPHSNKPVASRRHRPGGAVIGGSRRASDLGELGGFALWTRRLAVAGNLADSALSGRGAGSTAG